MIVIYHNPACGTSRNVLDILRKGHENVRVIEYLKTGWTEAQLLGLFAAAGLTAREALRETKSPAAAMGLLETGVSEERILQAMVAEPVLVNRPIVCSPKGVRLCRPSEAVLDLMAELPPGPIRKEDGTVVLDEAGRRV